MRLLNVKSFKLEEFQDDVPKYAIGSHRWSFDEALFSDVRLARNTEGDGYKKLVAFADYMKQNLPAVEWLWIDTCCINHQDPTEVTQNLDFMFKWFRNAEVCLAYLADVEVATDMDQFRQSVWFTRCWTLQDLLAPRIVVFLSASWETSYDLSVDVKMSWMNGRASTREEDTWYALCGILDAVIGTRYGEGHARAKRRLLDAV
ncbi:uncharacterized protein K489DRAFT_290005, partial [Dissoconium aciculare CBS 342.82]|uniref:Heterokaryon incompatibility domain-containing protein n=1 Tax=Dissoconium aciculare CBS 342.82 TaxID=1314786 RepID=A0A6J3LUA7_9PEZI